MPRSGSQTPSPIPQGASPAPAERIRGHLVFLYGQERGLRCYAELERLLAEFRQRNPAARQPAPARQFSQADSILITYGDQVSEPGTPPLQSLAQFLRQRVKGAITGVHLLPFFPYSSDDGFSVIDYTRVDPALGSWEDVAGLSTDFSLMFDAVINHVSSQSEWFQHFLQDDPDYADYFIVVEPGTDLSQVTRPRALPLLTAFQTPSGEKLVWTTFSADQLDLNYANPEVLLRVLGILLGYVERGASLIRLDAIAYLWKTIGTSCIHLEQTHRMVQLCRAVLDAVAPHVSLITETNVPHAENVSYFGDGANEAQMVYQFPLAPLVLSSLRTGDAGHLLEWAAGLEGASQGGTFFNFTASHDGIGVMPAQGILSAAGIQALVDQTLAHGGHVSHKTNPDGSQSVYELNISYFDALSDPKADEPQATQVARFMVSQAIMLALKGVPGIYVHSLFGSRSWREGVAQTGRLRSINREKFSRAQLEAELADPGSLRHQVFQAYTHMLRQRASHRAFHPHGNQEVLPDSRALFTLLRTAPDGQEQALCIHNVSGQEQNGRFQVATLTGPLADLISGQRYSVGAGGKVSVTLRPYQILWLVQLHESP